MFRKIPLTHLLQDKDKEEEEGAQFGPGLSLRSEAGPLLIEDGVFWSREVEASVPRGLDDDLVQVRRILRESLRLEDLF